MAVSSFRRQIKPADLWRCSSSSVSGHSNLWSACTWPLTLFNGQCVGVGFVRAFDDGRVNIFIVIYICSIVSSSFISSSIDCLVTCSPAILRSEARIRINRSYLIWHQWYKCVGGRIYQALFDTSKSILFIVIYISFDCFIVIYELFDWLSCTKFGQICDPKQGSE